MIESTTADRLELIAASVGLTIDDLAEPDGDEETEGSTSVERLRHLLGHFTAVADPHRRGLLLTLARQMAQAE